jgi:hypothetical protein
VISRRGSFRAAACGQFLGSTAGPFLRPDLRRGNGAARRHHACRDRRDRLARHHSGRGSAAVEHGYSGRLLYQHAKSSTRHYEEAKPMKQSRTTARPASRRRRRAPGSGPTRRLLGRIAAAFDGWLCCQQTGSCRSARVDSTIATPDGRGQEWHSSRQTPRPFCKRSRACPTRC